MKKDFGYLTIEIKEGRNNNPHECIITNRSRYCKSEPIKYMNIDLTSLLCSVISDLDLYMTGISDIIEDRNSHFSRSKSFWMLSFLGNTKLESTDGKVKYKYPKKSTSYSFIGFLINEKHELERALVELNSLLEH